MKKIQLLIAAVSIVAVTSPGFAAHDHGTSSQGSMDHRAPVDEKSAKECAQLLSDSAQHVARIQRQIQRLQAEVAGKHPGPSVQDELKKAEQHLKEANDTMRALQIM